MHRLSLEDTKETNNTSLLWKEKVDHQGSVWGGEAFLKKVTFSLLFKCNIYTEKCAKYKLTLIKKYNSDYLSNCYLGQHRRTAHTAVARPKPPHPELTTPRFYACIL